MAAQKPGGKPNGKPSGTPAKPGSATKPTTSSSAKSTTGKKTGTDLPPASTRPERYVVKPEFWDRILDGIPPWIDEIAAILLIVFGVVSLLSLLNVTTDATISTAWSNALTSLFGYGSAIVCIGIFALGVIILLPKLGIVIRFPARRILAIEFAFFSVLALLHLASGDVELRSVARLGQGGGQVGWALSSAVVTLVGTSVAAGIFTAILLISIAVVVGIRRERFTDWLKETSTALRAFGEARRPVEKPIENGSSRLDEGLAPPVHEDHRGTPVLAMPTEAQRQRVRTHSIMRIRVDRSKLPPSMRPAPTPPPEPAPMGVTPPAPAVELPPVVESTPQRSQQPPLPVFSRRESDFNAIGTLKGKPTKTGGFVPVERPDGRIKRYFTVSGMKEPKQVGKRDPALPPLNLMKDVEVSLPDEREINQNVVLIENTLLEFDIEVDVVDVKVGPTVTQYAVQPYTDNMGGAPTQEVGFSRTRISKIASLQSDLALALSAKRLRMETPVPGHSYIGIEVPNRNPSVVALRSVYESKAYYEQWLKKKSPLFVPLGRDVSGAAVGVDLSQMPHLLIAGTTGSGKSVCIAALATALIMDNPPDAVKLVMLDPKMVELSRFNGVPHLLGPVETDQERIIGVLRWCTREMDRRYKVLEENAARNIDTYNQRLGRRRKDEYMPYIVVLIDEIGDLMMSHPDETEKTVTRLAQMARAVGIHLVVATQRPSVDVITGLIKANFPSRISFAVASGIDSRVIIDASGAETLMGHGDMLYQPADAPNPRRLQGCFVSDDEVRTITQYWREWSDNQRKEGALPSQTLAPWERGLTRREFLAETDPLLEQAIALVVADGEASASLIQRRLGVGYPRAARIMDLLLELRIVGDFKEGGRSREVLIKDGKDPFKDLIDKRMRGG